MYNASPPTRTHIHLFEAFFEMLFGILRKVCLSDTTYELLRLYMWYDVETFTNESPWQVQLMSCFFFSFFLTLSKISFWFVKYIPATWPNWWYHNLSSLVKGHHFCKFELYVMLGSWDLWKQARWYLPQAAWGIRKSKLWKVDNISDIFTPLTIYHIF